MSQLSTWSGSDVSCTLVSPLYGSIQFGGIAQSGIGEISFRMDVDHASIQYGMDGAPVPSYKPGEGGVVEIGLFQTSTTHQAFIQAYNTVLSLALLGDVSQAFEGVLVIANLVTGIVRTCTGGAFTKIPDETYGDQAQQCRWMLRFANIITE